jgi:hypothetical protein
MHSPRLELIMDRVAAEERGTMPSTARVRSVLFTGEAMQTDPRDLSLAALLVLDGLADGMGPWLSGQQSI